MLAVKVMEPMGLRVEVTVDITSCESRSGGNFTPTVLQNITVTLLYSGNVRRDAREFVLN